MFLNRIVQKLALPILSIFTLLSFTACNNDDEPSVASGDFVVSLAVQGSDNTFTYYSVPFEDIMTGSLSALGKGIEQPGYFDFTQIDNTIYSIGGLDDVNVVGINQKEDGSLSQIGNVSFQTSLKDIVKADNNTLVGIELSSTSDMVRFHTIDVNTVTVKNTIEHPVADLTDLVSPSYSGMVISGDHLFLSYYISDPTTFKTDHTDNAWVAVYSYPELQFQKVIEDTRTGPIGGFNVKSGLIKDEKGDVYALSHSNPANGFSQSTKPGGIMRIKSGETEFDQSYFFDIEEITGGKNTAHLKYLGDGKVFAEINMADRSQQAAWSDAPLKSAIIDLNDQTINYIDGVPEHSGSGRRLAALQDGKYIYMGIPEGNGIFIYKIDTENYTATKGAEVQANFIAGIFKY
ncbi:MAG TPA: DUF4374 domain-containing protein [Cytophagales bacterium]|nr:DUF4374 domain-containing protein [Cytophagales bacterium]